MKFSCLLAWIWLQINSGILLVVPLHLAITPTRVLEDPLLGPECRVMLEEGEVDDRFLIMLFLTVERLRKNSSWKPYLDMLPTTFGNPLWFSDDELLELEGTTLYRATELQKKNLQSLFDDKVKKLGNKLLALDGKPEREVTFEDFLWANSIFWTRALNIPFPRSCLFPDIPDGNDTTKGRDPDPSINNISSEKLDNQENGKAQQILKSESQVSGVVSTSPQEETIWVEGLVPGIDFCNHDLKPAATWEVDGTGSVTGVPFSMYLLSAGPNHSQSNKEISISYGNKGNEELLYLYGFVINDNPDDFLMVHYPVDAIQDVPSSDSKLQLLEAQKAELRCLLPRSLLNHGFFPQSIIEEGTNKEAANERFSSFSWSGSRNMPSYINKLVFPEEFLTALRTISMKESELYKVSSLLEELVGSGERRPSETEVRSAIWEACGDSSALQLLVDLINTKLMELEEGSGTEESDADLLEKAHCIGNLEDCKRCDADGSLLHPVMSWNRWSSIVYRLGQKQLARLFLKEAEHALQLALSAGN